MKSSQVSLISNNIHANFGDYYLHEGKKFCLLDEGEMLCISSTQLSWANNEEIWS